MEHRLKLARRAGDDLQHLRGGGLLRERFAQLAEQPRVFDGNHRLGGEVRQEFDVLVGERAYLPAVDREGSDRLALLEHWNNQQAADAGNVHRSGRERVASAVGFAVFQVGDLRGTARRNGARQGDVRTWPVNRFALPLFDERGGQITVDRTGAEAISFAQPHRAVTRLADGGRLRQHGSEYRREFATRA